MYLTEQQIKKLETIAEGMGVVFLVGLAVCLFISLFFPHSSMGLIINELFNWK